MLALKQWFHLLRGPQQVHVHTDHERLRYLKMCPQPLTPRQARWSQFLKEYNLILWLCTGSRESSSGRLFPPDFATVDGHRECYTYTGLCGLRFEV